SHLLLVCKKWRRITTPFLYETVPLITDEDTELLARTLSGTPAFGAYIRNLRLDGGYAKHLETVVKCAPNIRILSIDL
ncbi:hypothetical protein BC629DRAFT_1261227, partial [Irpex lacteus]